LRVLAVDPGKATGLALFRDVAWHPADGAEAPPEWIAWAAPWQAAMASVESWIALGALDFVACERFTVSQRTVTQGADHTWPTGGIGVVKYLCAKHSVPLAMQAPADAMNLAPRPVLERLGWRTKGVDHPDDATRHLVLRLATLGYQPLLRRLAASS